MKRKLIFLFVFIILFSFLLSPFCFSYVLSAPGLNDINTDDFELLENVFYFKGNYGRYYLVSVDNINGIDGLPNDINIRNCSCIIYRNYNDGKGWKLWNKTLEGNAYIGNLGSGKAPEIFWSNFDLKDDEGNIVFKSNAVVKPYIENKETVETGKFDKLIIKSGDYNKYDQQEFYLFTYYYSASADDNLYGLYPRKEILLDGTLNEYFVGSDSNGYYTYEVPLSATNVDLVEGNRYGFKLALMEYKEDLGYDVVIEYTDSIDFSIGVVTTEEKEQADRDKQLAMQEEQNKTNKGIWDTLKEVLDYINPFSENFFVYKLVSLLIDAIKGLFLPGEDYFKNYITDMNDWFSDRLGILYYPVDLVVTFLEKVGQLDESGSAVIHWTSFSFMGAELIPEGSYDLNVLIESNATLTNIHSIYLVFTDVILWLGLCFLAKNTFVDVFGGKYDEIGDYVAGGAELAIDYDNAKLARNKEKRRRGKSKLR